MPDTIERLATCARQLLAAGAEIERLRGERNGSVPGAFDQVEKILRFYASEPYADSSNQTVRVKAVLLVTAADMIKQLLARVAALEAGRDEADREAAINEQRTP